MEQMKTVTRLELRGLYESMTLRGLADYLGIKSKPTLYKLLDEAGIERKRAMSPRMDTFIRLVD